MHAFHAVVHAMPASAAAGPQMEIDGVGCATLAILPTTLSAPMAVSFEEAVESLTRLPRLFIEPDGALVWTGVEPAPWRVDGALFDLGGRLLYVEIKGACPSGALDQLLAGLGRASQPLVFQLIRQGVFLDEGEFRRFTAAG